MIAIRHIFFLCVLPVLLQAQQVSDRSVRYNIDDWVTYPVARFMTSVTYGYDNAYFGSTGGVLRWNYQHDRWETPYTVSSGLPDDEVRVVAFDYNSAFLWVATATGLSYIEQNADDVYVYDYSVIGNGPVTAMGGGKASFWIQTPDGYYRCDAVGGPFWRGSPQAASADEVRWQGRRPESLPMLYTDGSFHYYQQGWLSDFHSRQFDILSTAQDRYQRMWLATWGGGAASANLRTEAIDRLPFGPWIEEIHALVWSETGLWVGGRNRQNRPGGITHWNWEEDSWETVEAQYNPRLRSDRVTAMDGAGRYTWMGTDAGLVAFDEQRRDWRSWSVRDNLWSDEIHHLTLGEAGLWIATESGLNLMDTSSFSIRQIRDTRLIHRRIWRVEADGADLWAGTQQGLYHLDGTTGTWSHIPRPVGMQYLEVTALSVFGNQLWVGTDGGVMMLDKSTKVWTTYPAKHFPTQGFIHTLLADEERVWVGSSEGLLTYFKDENRWRLFTVEDGLPDNRVFSILLDGDYLWLGTGRGLTRFFWNDPMRID